MVYQQTLRLTFTQRALDRLPVSRSSRRVYYRDRKTPGLFLMVTPTGTKTFQFYRKIHGRPTRITIGHYPDCTIGEARTRVHELNVKAYLGSATRGSFGQLFQQYLSLYAKSHKRSWREDEANYRRHLSHWENLEATAISQAQVRALHTRIGQERGTYIANRILALLHTVFVKAQEWGHQLAKNPAQGIRKFPEQSRRRFLLPAELPRFLRAVSEESDSTWRDFFLLCLLTGARRRNVQAMRWTDINWDWSIWTIPVTKSGEDHAVPLCSEALKILYRRRESQKSGWVFHSRSKSGHIEDPSKPWRRILDRAGLQDLRVHDLRRTFGSWQAALGVSLPIIGKSLGHRQAETTAIYARLGIEPVRQAVETATQAMFTGSGYGPDSCFERQPSSRAPARLPEPTGQSCLDSMQQPQADGFRPKIHN